MGSSIGSILAGAKKTLANAQNFTKSVEGKPTSSFAHEYSNTPYSVVRQKSAGKQTPGESISKGLEAKRRNVEDYTKTYPAK